MRLSDDGIIVANDYEHGTDGYPYAGILTDPVHHFHTDDEALFDIPQVLLILPV